MTNTDADGNELKSIGSITIPVLNAGIDVFVLGEYMQTKNPNGGAYTAVNENGLIGIFIACDLMKDINVIVHESVHAVTFILKDRNIKQKNDELFAYCMGYIVDKLYTICNEYDDNITDPQQQGDLQDVNN